MMATYDLIECAEVPQRNGNAQPLLPLPIIKKTAANTGATIQLQANTRYVRVTNPSANIAYKAGHAQADVENANIPAAATDLVLKTTDLPADHVLEPGTRWFRAE